MNRNVSGRGGEPPSYPQNVTPLPVPRKKHRGRRRVLIALLLVLTLAVALNWGKLSPTAVVETFQGFFGEFGENRYPVQLSQGTFRQAAPLGSDVGVVTDTSFLVYTSTGRQISSRRHSLGNPRIVSNGGHAVLYDAGGKQLRSETRFTEPFTAATADPITAAAVSRTGAAAVATLSENYLSAMTVYDPSGSRIFNWDCAAGRILALALSPDGTRCAASVILSSDGDIESDLYFYNLSSQKPTAVEKLTGTLIFSLQYRSSNRLLAIGDNKAVSFDARGSQAGFYAYGDRTLKCYESTPSAAVLTFSRYGVGQDSTLVSLSADAGASHTVNVDRNIRMAAAGGGVAALSPGGIQLFGGTLSPAGSHPLTGDVSQLLVLGKQAYAFTPTTLYQYSIG